MDGSALGYGWVNVTDLVNISNYAPVNDNAIPNVSLLEDHYNNTLNMTLYFRDYDAHDLNYTVSVQDGNVTITVDNNTNIMNITLLRDFYGSRSANVTAIDSFGGNVTSNTFWINVSNQIEVNLTLGNPAHSGEV